MGPRFAFGPALLLVALLGAQLASAAASEAPYRDRHRRHSDSAPINQREPGEAISALIGLTSGAEPPSSSSSQEAGGSTSERAAEQHQPGASSNQSNANPSTEEHDDSSLIMSSISANAIIFVIGSLGNAVVILVIMKFTKSETVTDIYILNLAFADLMFLTGLIFLNITMIISHWIFGNLMCKLYMASTSLNQFASSLLLVVMSFDRFLAVCHPIYAQRFRRIRTAKVICLSIWVICLILMTPIFTYAKTSTNNGQVNPTCAIAWPDNTGFNCELAFTLYAFACGFFLPLLLIACFYLCVIKRLRLAARNQLSGLNPSRRSRSRETTNKRIEHLVIGIIFTYTVCWLPYWITQLWVSISQALDRQQQNTSTNAFYAFFLLATSLSYTNSAVNPILYAFLSDNFKRRCSEIIRSVARIRWCPALLAGKQASAAGAGPRAQPSASNNHHHHQEDRHQPANSNHYLALPANSNHQATTNSFYSACYCEPTEALVTGCAPGADADAEADCRATAAQLMGDLNWRRPDRPGLPQAEARIHGNSQPERSDKRHGL